MRTLLISRAIRLAAASVAVALGVLLTQTATAGQGCDSGADRCGLRACSKCGNCQLTCGVKEEKKTVWVVKCESMCTMLPGCGHPEKVCAGDGCGKCGESCAASCDGKANGCACLVPPKCGRQRDIKKLEKKEIVVKKPTYKCVACGCEQADCKAEAAAPTKTPADAAPALAPTPKAPKAPKPEAPKKQALNPLPKLTAEEAPSPPLANLN